MNRPNPFDESPRLSLEAQLAELLRQAHKLDGRDVSLTLARGLRITLRYSFEGALVLQLSRSDAFPSATEWSTVLRHFPGGAEQVDEKLEAGQDTPSGRYWMRGRISTTPTMI